MACFLKVPSHLLSWCWFTVKSDPWYSPGKILQKMLMNYVFRYYISRFTTIFPKRQLVKTHWGRVTHIRVLKLTITGSDNGLSPGRRQAIFWTNPGILLIGPLGSNFSEILIGIQTFSFKKMHLKISSAKWRPFCLGLNVLTSHSSKVSDG